MDKKTELLIAKEAYYQILAKPELLLRYAVVLHCPNLKAVIHEAVLGLQAVKAELNKLEKEEK
ncbi:MAG: hypothetical protein JRE40_15305 [Deltaproteobacteria bacterium]|nr:hypothetical protein [Deltaproteobacteria bacterium]